MVNEIAQWCHVHAAEKVKVIFYAVAVAAFFEYGYLVVAVMVNLNVDQVVLKDAREKRLRYVAVCVHAIDTSVEGFSVEVSEGCTPFDVFDSDAFL